MTEPTENQAQTSTEDIIFECPKCGKSLEIDAKGAGYLIVCPDCKNEIQVPSWDELESGATLEAVESDASEDSADEDDDVSAQLARLQSEVERLENLRKRDEVCFKRLGDELLLIQAALDRVTEIVESRQSNS